MARQRRCCPVPPPPGGGPGRGGAAALAAPERGGAERSASRSRGRCRSCAWCGAAASLVPGGGAVPVLVAGRWRWRCRRAMGGGRWALLWALLAALRPPRGGAGESTGGEEGAGAGPGTGPGGERGAELVRGAGSAFPAGAALGRAVAWAPRAPRLGSRGKAAQGCPDGFLAASQPGAGLAVLRHAVWLCWDTGSGCPGTHGLSVLGPMVGCPGTHGPSVLEHMV